MTVDTYKVLGQAAPAATTDTDVYTVPASTAAIVSAITVANRSTADDYIFCYVRIAGASSNQKQTIREAILVPANGFITLVEGITLGAADVITVNAGTANLSVNVFGVEQTSLGNLAPKVLGQVWPTANTLTDIYTVPAGKSAILSSLIGANLDQNTSVVRVAASVGGGAVANKDYLVYDYSLAYNPQGPAGPGTDDAHLNLTLGMTLAAGDKFRVRANADVAFNLFGIEVS